MEKDSNLGLGTATAVSSAPGGSSSDFVKKLYKMLEDPTYKHIVRWSDTGDSFVVLDNTEFTKNVLPRHFKHSNFASFVRQLNKYDFHKIRNTDEVGGSYGHQAWEFKHPNFQLHNRGQLENIKRKAPAQRKQPRENSDSVASQRTLDQVEQLRAQLRQFTESQRSMDEQLENNNATCQALVEQVRQLHRNLTEYEDVIQGLLVSLSRKVSENKDLEQQLLGQRAMQMDSDGMAIDGPECFSIHDSVGHPAAQINKAATPTETPGKLHSIVGDIPGPESVELDDSLDASTWKLSPFDPGGYLDDPSVRMFFTEQTPELSETTSPTHQHTTFNDDSNVCDESLRSESSSWKLPHPLNVPQSQQIIPERVATPPSPITLPPILKFELNRDSELPALSDLLDRLMGPACLWDSRIIMPRRHNSGAYEWSHEITQPSSTASTARDREYANDETKKMQPIESAPGLRPGLAESQIRILIVDDDATCRRLLAHLLSSLGLDADFAPDGIVALELANRFKYSVIFMDNIMPKLDGVSTARLIRRSDKTTPIIYMMSNPSHADVNAWKRAGMTAMLPKPFGYKKFYSMMYKHLPKSAAQKLPRNLRMAQQIQPNNLQSSSLHSPGRATGTLSRSPNPPSPPNELGLTSGSDNFCNKTLQNRPTPSSGVLGNEQLQIIYIPCKGPASQDESTQTKGSESNTNEDDEEYMDYNSSDSEEQHDGSSEGEDPDEDEVLYNGDFTIDTNKKATDSFAHWPQPPLRAGGNTIHGMRTNIADQSFEFPMTDRRAGKAADLLPPSYLKPQPGPSASPGFSFILEGDMNNRSENLASPIAEILAQNGNIFKRGLELKSPEFQNPFTPSPASTSTPQYLSSNSDVFSNASRPDIYEQFQNSYGSTPYSNQGRMGSVSQDVMVTPSVSGDDESDYPEHCANGRLMDVDGY